MIGSNNNTAATVRRENQRPARHRVSAAFGRMRQAIMPSRRPSQPRMFHSQAAVPPGSEEALPLAQAVPATSSMGTPTLEARPIGSPTLPRAPMVVSDRDIIPVGDSNSPSEHNNQAQSRGASETSSLQAQNGDASSEGAENRPLRPQNLWNRLRGQGALPDDQGGDSPLSRLTRGEGSFS